MSTKKNIQTLREWAYSNNAFKKEHTAPAFMDPTLSSKERYRLKRQNERTKDF
jgi:hypothetical protein